MKRRSSPRRVSIALEPLQNQWAPDTPLARVQRAWLEAVGESIAAQAKPVSERGGTVTIACESAGWAQELDLRAPELTARLNELLGGPRVARLRCTATG